MFLILSVGGALPLFPSSVLCPSSSSSLMYFFFQFSHFISISVTLFLSFLFMFRSPCSHTHTDTTDKCTLSKQSGCVTTGLLFLSNLYEHVFETLESLSHSQIECQPKRFFELFCCVSHSNKSPAHYHRATNIYVYPKSQKNILMASLISCVSRQSCSASNFIFRHVSLSGNSQ